MPPRKSKKKKAKRRLKSKAVTIILSGKQMLSLKDYCKRNKTTPNKVIKKQLAPCLSGKLSPVSEERYVAPNQLDLFGSDF